MHLTFSPFINKILKLDNQVIEMGTLKEDKFTETTKALMESDKAVPTLKRIKNFKRI